MLGPNLLKSKIPFLVEEEGPGPNLQLLMLSPNLLKSQIPYMVGGGGFQTQFPTFDAEPKYAKIPNSLSLYGGGGGVGLNFQLLMLSPNNKRQENRSRETSGWKKSGGNLSIDYLILLMETSFLMPLVPLLYFALYCRKINLHGKSTNSVCSPMI